jgi:hypothetical protein
MVMIIETKTIIIRIKMLQTRTIVKVKRNIVNRVQKDLF